jgi:hypothetical protein
MSDLSTLRRQLERLAADAPLTVPDRQLWRRGLRQARLRRGGSAVIVALVLLAMVAIGGLAHIRSQPQPASPHGSGGIPSRLYAPSG